MALGRYVQARTIINCTEDKKELINKLQDLSNNFVFNVDSSLNNTQIITSSLHNSLLTHKKTSNITYNYYNLKRI